MTLHNTARDHGNVLLQIHQTIANSEVCSFDLDRPRRPSTQSYALRAKEPLTPFELRDVCLDLDDYWTNRVLPPTIPFTLKWHSLNINA